jgi:hypothetical protein
MTRAKNLEKKFDRSEEVLDYFDAPRARVIRPRSVAKTKVTYPAKNSRSVVVREKSGTYRKNARRKAKRAP